MSAAPDVLIAYRNLRAANPRLSHVGLGINAIHTCKCLRAAGIPCDVVGVADATHLSAQVAARPATTHVVIEAPFLPDADLLSLCNRYSRVEFCCRVHSQVGFLQVEAGAVRLMRDYLRLQDHLPNFRLSANAGRLSAFLDQVYRTRSLLLPNLYDAVHGGRSIHRPPTSVVRIGSFGAIRLMKGHMTAAAAALALAAMHRLGLEFHLSVNREEHGRGVLEAIRALFADVPVAKLIEVPWSSWSDFRRTIASMDLHLQLSASETFNLTVADAVAGGVPSVVSEAIDWVPAAWVSPLDDAEAVARKGWSLLNDPHAADDGRRALDAYNHGSLARWKAWLGVPA